MEMLYANFTESSINYGNYIIEYATRQFLKDYLRGEIEVDFISYDSFGKKIPEGNFDGLFIPGCTMITPGQNKSLNLLKDLDYQSYCLAGSLWYPNSQRKFLIKSRLLSWGKKNKPDLSIVKQLSGVIGSRDRYTFNTLKNAGLKTLYTGCPTLLL
ncbi:MAG: hypothetical protein SVR94_14755, partial [Pseudomonadota bacterium]|nr:hypothetical protein [Pseudomonadota bacterium]